MDSFIENSANKNNINELLHNSDSDNSSASLSIPENTDNFGEEGLSISSVFRNDSAKADSHIYIFLSKVFQDDQIRESDFGFLTDNSLSYIREILRKKFIFGANFENFELIKPRRRNEEQFKFVIKKGFKRLFKIFKKQHNGFIKGDKLLDEFEFYRFYFWETANYNRQMFEGFLLPGSKIQKEFASPNMKIDKTVSFAYLSRIFKSEAFKRDFISYLLNDFVDEYIQIRNQKLLKIAVYFVTKKKLKSNKLPWTKLELYEAQKSFVNLICSFGN